MADSGEKMSDAARREEEILAFWNDNKIFEKTVQKEAPKGRYVFYDGPPFATGLPHYGHIVASIIKDVVPRYWTMQGYNVPRRWGWDCHGLPIENIVEKGLGFKHKKDILKYGVAKFNELCRTKVMTYADEWKKIIPRIGRWADMDNPYFTMDRSFMESVWWAFKQLWDKGLVYEDYRSIHICPRCETTLSQSEVTEGYKEVKDIAVTVKFKLKNPEKLGLSGDVYLLAWTTTPWTLPGNVALAVGAEIAYLKIGVSKISDLSSLPSMLQALNMKEGESYIASENYWRSKGLEVEVSETKSLSRFFEAGSSFDIERVGTLVGLEYEPLFDYYTNDPKLKNRENGWKVYAADFVTAEDGTGIAHEAPAFGADDWALLKKVNLPFVQHVNMDGTMKPEVKAFAGMEVKPRSDDDSVRLGTDIAVLKYLQEHGLLFAKENITHAYPHCWRCDSPLLNYATSSWFVKIEAQKEELLKTAKPINWSPVHMKEGRWGKWLEGARDWSISRQRFWASVMPIWRCEKCHELRVFGSASELEEASGKTVNDLHKHIVDEITVPCACGGTMRRIPDVIDTWFDSGSMPYGQAHYPFEHKEEFEQTFPAQFIAEGQDQTRAWFYYLHVLATSIFDKNAFENVIVNGIVLAEDGKKMSKRLNNYPDPMLVVHTYGADALRLYLLASPVMQAENLNFTEKGVAEWRSVLTRLENVLSFYELYRNAAPHEPGAESKHVLDRWILARLGEISGQITSEMNSYNLTAAARPLSGFIDDLSTWYLRRSRERIKNGDADALATTLFVLRELAKLMAPFAPFIAERLWQELKQEGDEESVHLTAWPEEKRGGFLAGVFGEQPGDLFADMAEARRFVTSALEQREKAGVKVRQPLAQLAIPGSSALTDEYLAIIADEVNVKRVVKDGDDVSLDTALTDELREEGAVRDALRLIMDARKAAGLKPGEQGSVSISVPEGIRATVANRLAELEQQTSTSISLS